MFVVRADSRYRLIKDLIGRPARMELGADRAWRCRDAV